MHIRTFFIAMKKVFSISKYTAQIQYFPRYIPLKNVINDIDEDISAVV